MSCRVPKFFLITIISILGVSILLSLFALGGLSFYKNDIAHASSATTSLSANGATNITLSPSSNSSIETSTGSSSLEYSARFLCGTIVGEDGPLRPGRYDSDINIFNRQIFPVSFTWKAVLSSDFQDNTQKMDEKNSNFILMTLNALEVASREIVLQLIEYSITNQGKSTKIPSDMMSRVPSVAVPIRTNETLNPDKQVRDILTREYSLSTAESQSLDILIRNLSLGVGALDDNHAISLQRINAYQPPSNLQ